VVGLGVGDAIASAFSLTVATGSDVPAAQPVSSNIDTTNNITRHLVMLLPTILAPYRITIPILLSITLPSSHFGLIDKTPI
jgi:hypothetical protein